MDFSVKLFIILSLLMVDLGCGTKEEKKEDSAAEDEMTMTGTLVVSNASSSLALTDLTSMDIFCQDYSNPPKTCTIAVDADGAFSGGCADLISSRFFCSIRENGVIVGDLPLGDSLSVLAGQGTVKFSADVDAETGTSESTIDTASSDALADGSESGEASTFGGGIEGLWSVSCVNEGTDVTSFNGKDNCPDGEEIYFSKAEEDGVTKITPWQSKTIYDACTATAGGVTYSTAKPHLHIKVNGDATQSVDVDISSVSNFGTSLQAIYALLPTKLQDSLSSTASAIVARAGSFKATITAIRKSTTKDFGGILEYEVPTVTDVRTRLLIQLLDLRATELENLDWCVPLLADDTITSAYRRIHSLRAEMICQLRKDKVLTDVVTFLKNTNPESCYPKLFFDLVYDPGTKKDTQVLLCKGSQDSDGACYDSAKNFIGDIQGRHQVLTVTDHPEGVFDMVAKQIIEKQVINPTQGLKTCRMVNRISIKGKEVSDTSFEAIFSEQAVDRCEGFGASQQARDFYGDQQSAQVQRYADTWKAVFEKVE